MIAGVCAKYIKGEDSFLIKGSCLQGVKIFASQIGDFRIFYEKRDDGKIVVLTLLKSPLKPQYFRRFFNYLRTQMIRIWLFLCLK